jgi:hypothetical protein
MKQFYSLADLARITGAKRRSIQLWAEAAAIRAARRTERAGSGVHRSFSRDEAIIACILGEFAKDAVAIGGLIKIAEGLRSYLSKQIVNNVSREAIEKAIMNEKDVFVFVGVNQTPILMYDMRLEDYQYVFGFLDEKRRKITVIYLNPCLRGLRDE